MSAYHRLRLLTIVAVFGSLVTPAAAFACPWNVFHYFNPAPPCEVLDGPLKSRITQTNTQIVAHLTEIAEKIQDVQVEVNQWNRAYTQSTSYQDKLSSVYGELTTSPLPSLVSAYNTTGISSYAKLGQGGGWALTLTPIDIRQSLDSMHDALEGNYTNLYQASTGVLMSANSTPYRVAGRLDNQLKGLLDYQNQSQALRDSLQSSATRNASRYAGGVSSMNANGVTQPGGYTNATSAGGDAEAKLSDLAAAMSRLRGTAFDVQGDALQARQQALDGIVRTQRDLRGDAVKYNPRTYVF